MTTLILPKHLTDPTPVGPIKALDGLAYKMSVKEDVMREIWKEAQKHWPDLKYFKAEKVENLMDGKPDYMTTWWEMTVVYKVRGLQVLEMQRMNYRTRDYPPHVDIITRVDKSFPGNCGFAFYGNFSDNQVTINYRESNGIDYNKGTVRTLSLTHVLKGKF